MDVDTAAGQRLLLAFPGKDEPSAALARALRQYRPSGLVLFRSLNIDSASQLRAYTERLQRLARELDLAPLLIAADQEGGQLMAVGDATPLPGNMALGATGSADLARRAGEVLGRELAALGVNVNFAPCVDVNVNPQNPVVGVRSFGENPDEVARLAAALIAGIQSQGVAATAKHFPGHGDTDTDSHHGLPAVPHALARLRQVEFPPFQAAIAAGVQLVMTAHLALPAVDGPAAPPATLSANILHGLLRGEMGFRGVIITDAMDMRAIAQGDALGANAVRAAAAGADLLLLTADPDDHRRVHASLRDALARRALDPAGAAASLERIAALKRWLAGRPQPDLSVVGSAAHRRVAAEIAERSITLVRDTAGLLPLRARPEQRIAAIVPRPTDLTPADTSSTVTPTLAAALRERHPNVDEVRVSYAPDAEEIARVAAQVRDHAVLIIGTFNACTSPGQALLVSRLLGLGIPTVVVALRLPYDLAAFPEAPAYVCTYSVLEPSMQALAAALFGRTAFQGRLPVAIPGLQAAGA
jgi:beta-N-acetylhexosaminidase